MINLMNLTNEHAEVWIRVDMISSFYYIPSKDRTYVYVGPSQELNVYDFNGNHVAEIIAAIQGYSYVDGVRMVNGQIVIDPEKKPCEGCWYDEHYWDEPIAGCVMPCEKCARRGKLKDYYTKEEPSE